MGAVTIQIIDNESEKSLRPTTSDSKGPRAERPTPLRAPFQNLSQYSVTKGGLKTTYIEEAEEHQDFKTRCSHPDTETSDSGQKGDERTHVHSSKSIHDEPEDGSTDQLSAGEGCLDESALLLTVVDEGSKSEAV
jgi:hypothetical protein